MALVAIESPAIVMAVLLASWVRARHPEPASADTAAGVPEHDTRSDSALVVTTYIIVGIPLYHAVATRLGT